MASDDDPFPSSSPSPSHQLRPLFLLHCKHRYLLLTHTTIADISAAPVFHVRAPMYCTPVAMRCVANIEQSLVGALVKAIPKAARFSKTSGTGPISKCQCVNVYCYCTDRWETDPTWDPCFMSHMPEVFNLQYTTQQWLQEKKQSEDEERLHSNKKADHTVMGYEFVEVGVPFIAITLRLNDFEQDDTKPVVAMFQDNVVGKHL